MKTWRVALLLIAAVILVAGCGNRTSSGKVLVEINGDKITEGDLKFLGEINPRIQGQLDSPEGRQRILDNLVEQDLLYQQAVKEGVNRDAVVKAKVDLYRRVIIAQSLVEKEIEAAAKKYYEANPDEFKKLRLSEIMVKFTSPDQVKIAKKGKDAAGTRSEAEALKVANELKAKIDGGAKFEEVAKESSEDAATKARGGDIGLVSKGDKRLEARGFGPLLEKAFELKVGEVSGPIKTQDGYFLITVTRGLEPEPFDEAKQAILFKVRNDSRQELLARIKKDAKVVYPDEVAAKKKAEEEAKNATAAGEKPAEAAGAAAAPAVKEQAPTGEVTLTAPTPQAAPAPAAKPEAAPQAAKKPQKKN